VSVDGPLVLFWVFAVGAVLGAIATVTRRNPVVAVVCLVGTFFCLAVEFLLLYASFLAAIQVLVYAGAIMVLFVFVVMVVNRAETEPFWHVSGPVTKLAAVAAVLVLMVRGWPALVAPPERQAAVITSEFGTVSGVGQILLGELVFPFEVVSILLLIAVVGSLVVARQHHDKDRERESPAP
jgi:NADH-quinone oxidoreductase subunit J